MQFVSCPLPPLALLFCLFPRAHSQLTVSSQSPISHFPPSCSLHCTDSFHITLLHSSTIHHLHRPPCDLFHRHHPSHSRAYRLRTVRTPQHILASIQLYSRYNSILFIIFFSFIHCIFNSSIKCSITSEIPSLSNLPQSLHFCSLFSAHIHFLSHPLFISSSEHTMTSISTPFCQIQAPFHIITTYPPT